MPDHSTTGNVPAGDIPSPSCQPTDTRRPSVPAAAIVALVGVDLASKRWAHTALADAPVKLPGPVDLQLAHNSGTAFGLFSKIPTIVVSIVVIALLIAVLNLWRTHRAPSVPVVLIVAGGLANTLDRFEAGSVVDMIHTGWWPTFNLADVFITIGVAYWIIASHPLPGSVKVPPPCRPRPETAGRSSSTL